MRTIRNNIKQSVNISKSKNKLLMSLRRLSDESKHDLGSTELIYGHKRCPSKQFLPVLKQKITTTLQNEKIKRYENRLDNDTFELPTHNRTKQEISPSFAKLVISSPSPKPLLTYKSKGTFSKKGNKSLTKSQHIIKEDDKPNIFESKRSKSINKTNKPIHLFSKSFTSFI